MAANVDQFLKEFIETRGIVVGPDTDLRAEAARILAEEAFAAARQSAQVLGGVNNDAVRVLQFTGDRLSGKLGGDNPLQHLVHILDARNLAEAAANNIQDQPDQEDQNADEEDAM